MDILKRKYMDANVRLRDFSWWAIAERQNLADYINK